MVCFGEFWVYFVRALARKNAIFPLEVVIWWTLKMYFWEVVNTLP